MQAPAKDVSQSRFAGIGLSWAFSVLLSSPEGMNDGGFKKCTTLLMGSAKTRQ
jgi:hypothetical protein